MVNKFLLQYESQNISLFNIFPSQLDEFITMNLLRLQIFQKVIFILFCKSELHSFYYFFVERKFMAFRSFFFIWGKAWWSDEARTQFFEEVLFLQNNAKTRKNTGT